MMRKSHSQLFGYSLAVISTGVATGLQLLAQPTLGDSIPYITFFPAVFVTAIFARMGPSLLAVVLSGLTALLWFIPPSGTLIPQEGAAWAGLFLFILFGFGVAALSERMHRKSAQVEWERDRFLVTLASIGDGVIVTDKQARITFLNSVAERLTGWSSVDAIDKPLKSVYRTVNEHILQTGENCVVEALKEGRVVELVNDATLISKDGTERAISENAAPIRDRDDGIVGAVLVFADVSKQRAAQLAACRLAALVDSSDDAILGQSFEGVVTDWNSGAERLFGYTANEIVGQSVFSTIVAAEQKDQLLEILNRVRQGGRGEYFETVRQCKDGRSIPVSVRISPILDATGAVTGASAIDRDISQRLAAEQRRNARLAVTQILAQESSIETAINKVLDAVCLAVQWEVGCFWRHCPEEGVLRCQNVWDRPFGQLETFRNLSFQQPCTMGQGLPGQVWASHQSISVADVLRDERYLRVSEAEQAGLHGAIACPVAVGQEFLGVVEWYSREIQQPDDDLLEMMATIGAQLGQFIDRREAEQKLRRSEQELGDFFENATMGLHWVGPDGLVLRVNQAELDMLGYSRDEVVGQPIEKFHVDQKVIEDILQCLASGQGLREYEARLRCKDGSIKHVLIDSNVLWEDGQFIHTRCFTRDITGRKRAEASLHESEERLRLALEAGRMGTWQWHIGTGEVIWSPTLEKIHGLALGDFPGTFEAFQKDIHPEDHQRVLESIRQTIEEAKEHHLEYRIVWPDRSIHWLEARGKVFQDETGNPVRVIGVCSDVTERKELEQRLQQQLGELADAESKTRSVVDNVIDGIITIDEQGLVASFNSAAEQIFGYSDAEIVGKDFRILMPESESARDDDFIANYSRACEAKMIGIGREVTGKRQDGSTFPLGLAVSEFHHGRQRLFTAIVRDITERKNLEQSLRFLAEASKSLSSLVDYKSTLQKVSKLAVPAFADWCAVDMLDADGSLQRLAVAHADPAKVELAEELHRRYPPQAHDPHGAMNVVRTGDTEVTNEIPDSMLEKFAHDDEHLQILRGLNVGGYMCVPLRTQKEVLGVLTFASAESRRRFTAEVVAIAEDLAHRATIAIENARLYDAVREADQRKDEFLAMLAHELRNPLVPIRSGLDILKMDAGDHEEIVQLMQEQVEHIVRLVDDLLDVSRIMRGKVELRKERVQLSTVLNRSVNTVRPVIESHRQKLVVNVSDETAWLDADPVRIVQVIENLLSNASKYMNDGGRIKLTTEVRGGMAVISVQDTGLGIEPDLLPKIFELFTQSTRSLDRSQGGLGIGLTLVERLVQLHDGTVSAFSEGLGHGSTFVVQLPVAEAPSLTDVVAASTDTARARRILVVDDNRGSAWLLSELLRKLGDHEIETACDGPSALAKIKELRPEIVFLDIGLPGMDGYQVGAAVREDCKLDEVLLVALTGHGQEEDRRKSEQVGFDQHLVKPPSVDQMKSVLNHPKLAMVKHG